MEKKLKRSSTHNILTGVCGGIAEYFGLSPMMVRLAYLILAIFTAAFPGILVYLLLWLVMPKK